LVEKHVGKLQIVFERIFEFFLKFFVFLRNIYNIIKYKLNIIKYMGWARPANWAEPSWVGSKSAQQN
jgi:hypothetical protein